VARHITILLLFGLLLSAPVLLHGLPDISIDGRNHAAWTDSFAQQLWNGDVYPRWFTDMNAGYGSPAFFFYPPLHGFVSAVFWPMVDHSKTSGWIISGYSCVLATLLAGLTAWFWVRSFTTSTAALAGAMVYMIAPYHLTIDLYNRGAAAEYWIFAWLPLVMWSAERIVRQSRYAVIFLALSYGLCVLSHTAVAACFAPLPIAYVAIFSPPESRIRSIATTICGLFLGIGLTGPFLLPAVFDQTKAYLADYPGHYRDWWLFVIRDKITEATGQVTNIPWYLSFKMRILVITVWMLLFNIFTYRLGIKSLSKSPARGYAGFFLCATLLSFFLMLRQSELIWWVMPPLQWLQFPYRLNTIIALSAAALAGIAAMRLKLRGNEFALLIVGLSLLGWFGAGVVSAHQAFSVWRRLPAERIANNAEIARTRMEPLPFWPKPADAPDLAELSGFESFLSKNPAKTIAFIGDGSGHVSIANWRPRQIELEVNCDVAGDIVLNHFYYQGWRASREDTNGGIPLTASQPNGFIELTVPKGSYDVLIQLPADKAEKQGRMVGLISLVACAGLFLWEYSRQTRTASEPLTATQAATSGAS
jgi:hypothetical protein